MTLALVLPSSKTSRIASIPHRPPINGGSSLVNAQHQSVSELSDTWPLYFPLLYSFHSPPLSNALTSGKLTMIPPHEPTPLFLTRLELCSWDSSTLPYTNPLNHHKDLTIYSCHCWNSLARSFSILASRKFTAKRRKTCLP